MLVHAADSDASLRFDKVFSDAGQPESMHYSASFTSRGAVHRMEVWRDGERRLKRRTDDAIETFVIREPGSAEYRLTILDRSRKIATRIDRSNLYRVGSFTDWYDLSHGIKHPQGPYLLVKARAPDGIADPVSACAWYDLTQARHTVHVCRDGRNRLPMLIVGEKGEVLWHITALDRTAAPAGTFDIQDAGYIRNDANQEMDRD